MARKGAELKGFEGSMPMKHCAEWTIITEVVVACQTGVGSKLRILATSKIIAAPYIKAPSI
ncbi:unnamed protein product [Citrullus colocynthis]|uniref:Uncharacterized protein n=1 Tax=Citrullus colocynthis TaxID=252529 RepID=A0ABP0Z1B9_9ROSI